MGFRPMKMAREILRIIPALRDLEQTYADAQIQLQQITSLLSMHHHTQFAVPPKQLQVRVAGAYKPGFFTFGRSMIADMEDLLEEQGGRTSIAARLGASLAL